MRRPGFDEWVMDIAKVVANRSRDPSTKVGCVVVRPDKSFAAVGYNGFPRNMPDKEEWWNDREEKYPRVVHAEMNALLASKEPLQGCTVYITHAPCCDCAKLLAAAGVKRVVWESHADLESRFPPDKSIEMLEQSLVQTTILDG